MKHKHDVVDGLQNEQHEKVINHMFIGRNQQINIVKKPCIM